MEREWEEYSVGWMLQKAPLLSESQAKTNHLLEAALVHTRGTKVSKV